MSNYQTILFSIEDQIATLTLNRPKSLNALNQVMLEEIEQAVNSLNNNDDLARVLIITGAGEKAFIAGADIKEMVDKTALEARDFSLLGNRVFKAIDNLPIPVIAAVNGFALGGGLELAMACDIRFASDNALAGLPEVNLGVIPGFGGTQRLSRIIGTAKTLELMFGALNVKAPEALQLGLFNRVFPQADLLAETQKYAEKIITKGPIAIKLVKQAVKSGIEMPLDQGLGLESELFGVVFATSDQDEGMKAFIEKRSAEFKNQ